MSKMNSDDPRQFMHENDLESSDFPQIQRVDPGYYGAMTGLSTGMGFETSGGSGRRIFQTIFNRWKIVLITTLLCVLGFGLFAFLSPKKYTRSCRMLIEPYSVSRIDTVNMEMYLNGEAQLISNNSAIHSITLAVLEEREKDTKLKLKYLLQGDDDLAQIKNSLVVKPTPNENTITLDYTSKDPDEAAYVLSALGQAYIRFRSTEMTKPKSGQSLEEVKTQKDKTDSEYHKAQLDLADVNGQIAQIKGREQFNRLDEQTLLKLGTDLNAARFDSATAKGKYDAISHSLFTDPEKLKLLILTSTFNGASITASTDEPSIKSQIEVAKRKLEELKLRYLPSHPNVRASIAKVEDLQASYVLQLYRNTNAADLRVKELVGSYESQKKQLIEQSEELKKRLSMHMLQKKEFEEKVEADKHQQGILSKRIDEETTFNQHSAVRIAMISEPTVDTPVDKIRPDVRLFLLEGLLAGLALGITMTFLDSKLRSTSEIRSTMHVPVLGVVPHLAKAKTVQARGRVMHLDPIGPAADALRLVRNSIIHGPQCRSILIASANNSEGRSSIASNLAIALAEAGNRVVLVDADLRSPIQHQIFNKDSEVGIASVVAGRIPLDRAIQSTDINGLELIASGPVPFNPAETINNQVFADMLSDLNSQFDYVILDCPPVLTATDARILSAMCDMTLLVIRLGHCTKRNATDARDGLLGFGANLLGIVVNDGTPDNRQSPLGGSRNVRARNNGSGNGSGRGSTMTMLPKH